MRQWICPKRMNLLTSCPREFSKYERSEIYRGTMYLEKLLGYQFKEPPFSFQRWGPGSTWNHLPAYISTQVLKFKYKQLEEEKWLFPFSQRWWSLKNKQTLFIQHCTLDSQPNSLKTVNAHCSLQTLHCTHYTWCVHYLYLPQGWRVRFMWASLGTGNPAWFTYRSGNTLIVLTDTPTIHQPQHLLDNTLHYPDLPGPTPIFNNQTLVKKKRKIKYTVRANTNPDTHNLHHTVHMKSASSNMYTKFWNTNLHNNKPHNTNLS